MPTKILTRADLPAYCRTLRERAGITQQQLAEALGYPDRRFIDNAERDASRVGVQTRIIQYFGGTIEAEKVYRVTLPTAKKA